MEFQQLEYFIKVAETGNITNASKELFITQPSLSIAIRRLEEDIGVPLFDRLPGKIVLNEAGKQFLTDARQILNERDMAKLKVADRFREKVLTVSIASTTSGFLPQILNSFMKIHPDYRFNLRMSGISNLYSQLSEREIDFAICPDAVKEKRCSWEFLYQEQYYAVANINHPLSYLSVFKIDDLEKYPFIIYIPSYDPENFRITRPFDLLRVKVPAQIVSSEFTVIYDRLKQDLNTLTILSESALYILQNMKGEFIIRPFSPRLRGENVGILRIPANYMPSAASEFYNYVKSGIWNDWYKYD